MNAGAKYPRTAFGPLWDWQDDKSPFVRKCEPWCKRSPRHAAECLPFTIADVESQPAGEGFRWWEYCQACLEGGSFYVVNDCPQSGPSPDIQGRRWTETTPMDEFDLSQWKLLQSARTWESIRYKSE